MAGFPHVGWVALFAVVPMLALLLASRDVRAFLRGTGSLRQTFSNAGVGALFLLTQLALRGVLIFGVLGAQEVAEAGPLSANIAPFVELAASVGRQPTLSRKIHALLVRDNVRDGVYSGRRRSRP